jgi:hypothetical protein
VHYVQKPLALEQNHIPAGEPLVTPDHLDKSNKQKTAHFRQAVASKKQRQKAVAVARDDNGVSALSTELQNQNNTAIMHSMTTALVDLDQTTNNASTSPTVTKRKRTSNVPTPRVPTTMAVPTGPPRKKCQGCVHGDLLEMKVMEPAHIRHYLKQAGFLEWAKCAGNCAHTIKAIHLASPKANLYYCDETIKGFSAPEDDLAKADMECGLILCAPCYAIREEKYALEHAKEGTVNRRTSRRSAKK